MFGFYYLGFDDRICFLNSHDFVISVRTMNDTFRTDTIIKAIEAEIGDFLIRMLQAEPSDRLPMHLFNFLFKIYLSADVYVGLS